MTHRTVIRFSATLLAALVLGCTDTGGPAAPEPALTVSPLFVGILPGQTQQLTASIGGTAVPVTWVSSNPAFVTVSASGLVTGIAAGFSAITATLTSDPTKLRSGNVTVLVALAKGVPVVVASSGARFSVVLHRIFVPAGTTNLTVTVSGGTGDVDIFLRHQLPPVTPTATVFTGTYACNSENGGNGELCSIANPATGIWQIALMVWDAYAGATLTATYTP